MMLYAESMASLKTRSEVRDFLARELDGLVGGQSRQDLPDDLANLATGSDREVIESSRRLDKCYEARGAAGARAPGTATAHQIRTLFAVALQRMKELPPDPRATLHAQTPATASLAPPRQARRARR